MSSDNGTSKEAKPGEAEPLAPAGKLLSEMVQASLDRGLHTPQAFLDRFPADAVMSELADQPKLRARILTACLGLPEQTAERLKPPVAGAALETALQAGDTTASKVLENFHPDDRVRELPWAALWAFVSEGDWWKEPGELTHGFMRHALERAQAHGLMDANLWRDGLTIAKLAKQLPRELVEKLFERAASMGASGKPFSGAEIFSIVKPADLVASFDLAYLYDHVVLPLARRCHFLVETGSLPPARATQTDLAAAARSPSAPPIPREEPDDSGWGEGEEAAAAAGKGRRLQKKTIPQM
jgi:hypothetical protein